MHRIRTPDRPGPDGVLGQLVRPARLELELGLSEARDLLVTTVIAAAVALVAAVALIAALVVLVAAAVAPFLGAPWQHLLVAGGGTVLLSLAAIAWSVIRLRSLDWPRQTITSFEENWQWLAAQLRSRLRLR